MHAATPDQRTARDRNPFALLLIDAWRDVWPDRMAARFPPFPADVERLLVGAGCPPEMVARGRQHVVLHARPSGGGPP